MMRTWLQVARTRGLEYTLSVMRNTIDCKELQRFAVSRKSRLYVLQTEGFLLQLFKNTIPKYNPLLVIFLLLAFRMETLNFTFLKERKSIFLLVFRNTFHTLQQCVESNFVLLPVSRLKARQTKIPSSLQAAQRITL